MKGTTTLNTAPSTPQIRSSAQTTTPQGNDLIHQNLNQNLLLGASVFAVMANAVGIQTPWLTPILNEAHEAKVELVMQGPSLPLEKPFSSTFQELLESPKTTETQKCILKVIKERAEIGENWGGYTPIEGWGDFIHKEILIDITKELLNLELKNVGYKSYSNYPKDELTGNNAMITIPKELKDQINSGKLGASEFTGIKAPTNTPSEGANPKGREK